MNLSWKGKGDKNLEFPEHYWKYLINTFGTVFSRRAFCYKGLPG